MILLTITQRQFITSEKYSMVINKKHIKKIKYSYNLLEKKTNLDLNRPFKQLLT